MCQTQLNSPSLSQNSVSSLLQNSTLEIAFRRFPKDPETFKFLRRIKRATVHVRPQRSHGLPSLKKIPYESYANALPRDQNINRASLYDGLFRKKTNPNPNFLVRICSGGVGVFHVKGCGPKSSAFPSKPRKTKLLARISRVFARYPGVPEEFENLVNLFHIILARISGFSSLSQRRQCF